jgi:hypothetical protein
LLGARKVFLKGSCNSAHLLLHLLQTPANWAAASLEMPMETTQDLWSMSRGDDVDDEQPKSIEEASKPALYQQAQRFDPAIGLALTYEPTLDPSMSLAMPLDHPVTTPALVPFSPARAWLPGHLAQFEQLTT